jgi:hypothetical protein
MKLYQFMFTLIFLLGVSPLWAQEGLQITGVVLDEKNEALIGAAVQLKGSDGNNISGLPTDIDGQFKFTDLQKGNYAVIITSIGYDEITKTVVLEDVSNDLGKITMKLSSGKTLDEVKITAQAVAVQQKEDTTQFNAGSFKVNPDATAEDLIRKMPGMDLSSGAPKAQGESVGKVLVDGKPFFGDDASSSLKNLPAEIVDKIQVYDERSEQSQFTGFDDGNTTKTINIITKAGKKEGLFGKVYAGGGSDGTKNNQSNLDYKYNVGGNLNYFKGDRRISLIGQTNNINVQNFAAQDLLGISGSSGGRGFGGGGGGRGGGMMGGGNNAFSTQSQGGINNTNAVGLNYSDKWGKKIDVTGSYFFNNTNNNTNQTITRNYVSPSVADQTYDELSNSSSKNYNHRFNMRFNYTIDSFNSILVVPSLSFQNNSSESYQQANTYRNLSTTLNSSNNQYGSNLDGYNIGSMFLYRHKFKKQGRTLSLWANGTKSVNDGNTNLLSSFNSIDTAYTVNQQADYTKNNWNINTNLSYTEPISKRSFLQAQYGINYQSGASDKRTYNYNPLTGGYSELDTLLTNIFNTDYLTHKGGLTYRYAFKKLNLNFGVDFQHAQLQSDRVMPYVSNLNKQFNNILPSARMQYQISKSKNMRFFYRTSTTAPSVDQLQDVINNANLLQLSAGNPNLKQSYQHRLNGMYNATNTNNNSTFFMMLSGTVTQDYIGNKTIIPNAETHLGNGLILQPGQQFTKPENMGGYYNVRSFATYGMPIKALKSNINVNGSVNYIRTPGIINDAKNYANNTGLGFGLVLSSNINENIDFTLSSNSSYNIVKNTLNTASNTNYFNQNSRLSVNYIFWKGIVFNTELNHQYYSGLTAGYNQNFLLWNMSLAKKILKQQGEIKFSVYDLLKQNNSIVPTVNDAYIQYARTNVLQQYFMVTFTYNLRYFKSGSSMKDVENKGNSDMMGGPPPGGMMPPSGHAFPGH